MEGPQFSTRAESQLYRSWGADIIGMTNLTEARLAREAEICYASLALVTDYDCWREATEDVSVETILAVLADNAAAARRSLAETVARVDPARRCDCRDAMRFGIITDRAAISPAARKRLRPDRGEIPVRSDGRIVVTGSVAFDYLMTFPGKFTEHLIPDKMSRLSVSFLVDEMRRVPGGCGPNIAYGLALLGERPLLLATAGADAAEYRDRLAREGVDVSGLRLVDDLFTASFFVSTDQDQNQLASFYTGRHGAGAGAAAELAAAGLDCLRRDLAQRPPGDGRARRNVPAGRASRSSTTRASRSRGSRERRCGAGCAAPPS